MPVVTTRPSGADRPNRCGRWAVIRDRASPWTSCVQPQLTPISTLIACGRWSSSLPVFAQHGWCWPSAAWRSPQTRRAPRHTRGVRPRAQDAADARRSPYRLCLLAHAGMAAPPHLPPPRRTDMTETLIDKPTPTITFVPVGDDPTPALDALVPTVRRFLAVDVETNALVAVRPAICGEDSPARSPSAAVILSADDAVHRAAARPDDGGGSRYSGMVPHCSQRELRHASPREDRRVLRPRRGVEPHGGHPRAGVNDRAPNAWERRASVGARLSRDSSTRRRPGALPLRVPRMRSPPSEAVHQQEVEGLATHSTSTRHPSSRTDGHKSIPPMPR